MKEDPQVMIFASYGELGNSEPAGDFAYNGTTSINSSNVIFGPDGTVDQISGSTVDFFPNPNLFAVSERRSTPSFLATS